MKIKTVLKAAGAALSAIVAAQPALAWDGITSGTVVGVEMNGGSTRIYFSGHPIACAGGNRYGFLVPSEPNYAAYVSAALLAMAQKTPVTAYTYTDGDQCHIATLVAGSSPFG